jgi:hypothetical protein
LFDFNLVKGKDYPQERGPPEFDLAGKTGGLLLHLTQSIHNSAHDVVLDSGLCVLSVSALIALQNWVCLLVH